jgi:hypothetical protein
LKFSVIIQIIVRELWLLYVSHSEVHFQYRKQTAPAATKSTVPDDELEALEDEDNNDANNDTVDEANMISMPGLETNESSLFGGDKWGQSFAVWPHLSYTQLIIFCYLGCVWLRWPIMLADLQRCGCI